MGKARSDLTWRDVQVLYVHRRESSWDMSRTCPIGLAREKVYIIPNGIPALPNVGRHLTDPNVNNANHVILPDKQIIPRIPDCAGDTGGLGAGIQSHLLIKAAKWQGCKRIPEGGYMEQPLI